MCFKFQGSSIHGCLNRFGECRSFSINGLHQWSTISGVVRLALQSMLILEITHNSQRVSGFKVSSRTKRMQNCASSMCPSKSSTGICSPLDEHPLFSVFSQTPRKHTHTTGLITFELISNCRTINTPVFMTPGHDGSIFQNRRKNPILWLESAGHL